MTAQDLINSVLADNAMVAADQAKLSTDQVTQALDTGTMVTDIIAAGVTEFTSVSTDGNTATTFTLLAGPPPSYTTKSSPIAGSIVIPPPAPATPTPTPTPAPAS